MAPLLSVIKIFRQVLRVGAITTSRFWSFFSAISYHLIIHHAQEKLSQNSLLFLVRGFEFFKTTASKNKTQLRARTARKKLSKNNPEIIRESLVEIISNLTRNKLSAFCIAEKQTDYFLLIFLCLDN